MRAPRLLVGVVADDVTGAGDIGGLLAKHGYAVRVFTAEADLESLPEAVARARTDAIIVDTDTRLESPEVAYDKVRRVTAALRRCGCGLYWKKTCSVFRGNVGAEFDAMLDELGASFGVAVAAFPKNGRTTVGGRHFVRGVPLAESEFRRDPAHPRTESDLVKVLAGQTRRRVALLPLETVRAGPAAVSEMVDRAEHAAVSYLLCDAETQDDLKVLAFALAREPVLLGSSALAEELPEAWKPPPPFDPLEGVALGQSAGVLVLAGSTMPQSRGQLEVLRASGVPVLALEGEAALLEPEAPERLALEAASVLAAGGTVAVGLESAPEAVERTRALGASLGFGPLEVSRRLSSILAEVGRLALERSGARRLIVLGGDSSAAACRALGVTETLVLDEIEPGLPASLTVGERPLLLVLKSGSFGGPGFVLKAVERLRGFGA